MAILITAQIDLPAEKRAKALAEAKPFVEGARSQRGCVHYDWSPDPYIATRINVYEEWSDEAALTSHFNGPHYKAMRDHLGSAGLTGATSHKYRCDAKESVYDATGTPQAKFTSVR